MTNGVSSELITATDGVSLHGIRVLWTIKTQYLNCQYSSLRVELNSGELGKDITVSDNSAEFLNLDCNRQYRPRVRAVVSHFVIEDHDAQLFYGGSILVLCCITYISELTLDLFRYSEICSITTLKSMCWIRCICR